MNSPRHTRHFLDERLVPAQVPWYQHQMIRDHVARYEFAASILTSQAVVLDLACGTGYGSNKLSTTSSQVYGVDISPDAVTYAQSHFASPRCRFLVADAIRLPFKANFFDAVVSFETLEHLKDQVKFLKEIDRVLKPDGTLIISTPNKLINGGKVNPFHYHEFTGKEFNSFLSTRFKRIDWFGQKPMPKPYLTHAIPIINRVSQPKIHYLLDSVIKMWFRGSNVVPITSIPPNWTPAFFVAICGHI